MAKLNMNIIPSSVPFKRGARSMPEFDAANNVFLCLELYDLERNELSLLDAKIKVLQVAFPELF